MSTPRNRLNLQTDLRSWMLVGVVASVLLLSSSPILALQVDRDKAPTKTWSQPRETNQNDPYGFNSVPIEGQDIGVDSREGTIIDGDIEFLNSDNQTVRFGDFFNVDKRPIMMSFNYSDCPKLCSVQLENMTNALREVDLQVGKDFQFISVSLDPKETTATAAANKALYLKYYNRPESADGWNFLVGEEDAIKNLADQCGYIYKYVPEQKLYSHTPAFILISPEGEIVRYIPGLDYDPNTVRRALIEAADGKIGSPVDWALYSLGCFSFDMTMGKYTFQAMALMRIAGLVTVLILILGLVPYWFFANYKERLPGGRILETSGPRASVD